MNKLEAKKEIKINSTNDCRNRLQKEKEKSPFKIVAEGLRLFMQYANVNLRECLCSILKWWDRVQDLLLLAKCFIKKNEVLKKNLKN